MADRYDAVVLAGGSARRLGGLDKPGLDVAGRTLLDRVLAAVEGAARLVVVGPRRTTSADVVWCREDPPGGGPVAALAAGLAEVSADRVVVLAGDLPFLTRPVVEQLLQAIEGDGAVAVDDDGRDQLLVGAWRTDALRRALPSHPDGASLRGVVQALDVTRVRLPTVAGAPAPWFDCDTDEDLATARGTT